MHRYWSKNWWPKIATFARTVQRVENWPTAVGLRLSQDRPGVRLLEFRDGMRIICRRNSSDWRVVSELALLGGYGMALGYLRKCHGSPVVLDLGGNIGAFGLLAARAHQQASVYTYEPGPPNFRQCEINRLLNPEVAERMHLLREGVGGETRLVEFFYDEQNPQSSSLYYGQGRKFPVQIRSLVDVVGNCGGSVALAKIDVEGAEFEIIKKTPVETWQRIEAISIEIHDDPDGNVNLSGVLERMSRMGYKHIEKEPVASASYFLRRS